jgi:hypothetical protein
LSEAGQFAAIKADSLAPGCRASDVRWEPSEELPTNDLFAAINQVNDADELRAIAKYIAFDTNLEFDSELAA